jgi:hypothetical protein
MVIMTWWGIKWRKKKYTRNSLKIVPSLLPPSPHAATAPSGPGASHYRGFMITLRHTTLARTPQRRVISPTQRPLPDNTQHSQQTTIHATGGIRTHNTSKRAVVDPRLRPRGGWYRLRITTIIFISR